MITQENLKTLYKKYLDIIELETLQFGCKPTEVRHLIGRLGEFYCALKVNGTLAHETNQHGFDVIAENGNRISVKTTAQKKGFVTINPRTIEQVEDLMFIQYKEKQLIVLYHGPIKKAVAVSRKWDGKYELDISKALKII